MAADRVRLRLVRSESAEVNQRCIVPGMPLILSPEAHEHWPSGEPETAAKLMVSAPGSAVAGYPVSHCVKRPRVSSVETLRKLRSARVSALPSVLFLCGDVRCPNREPPETCVPFFRPRTVEAVDERALAG